MKRRPRIKRKELIEKFHGGAVEHSNALSRTLGDLKLEPPLSQIEDELSAVRAVNIAMKAASLVGGDRNDQHGEMYQNHQNIAHVWNGILEAAGKLGGRALDAYDVANLMEGLKIARRYSGKFNIEDHVDAAGYAAVAGQIGAGLPETDNG